MRYLLRFILIISGTICLLFPVARLLGSQRMDGQIVYTHDSNYSDTDIYLFDVRTNNLLPLTRTRHLVEYSPAWIPQGRGVTFIENDNRSLRLRLFDFDTMTLSTIRPLENRACCVAWSPNGHEFVYTRGRLIILHNLMSGFEQVITYGSNPEWASENTVLYNVVIASSEERQLNAISIANPNRMEEATLLEFFVTSVAVSPNGRQVVFTSTQTGYSDVYVMDNNCNFPEICLSNVQQLIHNRATETSLSWSPNGQWIVYNAIDLHLKVIRYDGAEERVLPVCCSRYFEPSWSILAAP